MNDSDFVRIREIIAIYDNQYPQGEDSIAAAVVSAKHEKEEAVRSFRVNSKTGVINKSQSGRRVSVSLPSNLYIILKNQYPNLFKENIEWFKRKFPEFVI